MTEDNPNNTTIETPLIRSWQYTVNQSAKGCRITVHGDDIKQVVEDYMNLHAALQFKGYKIAPDEELKEIKAKK